MIDVETSGFRPSSARVISLAMLALDAEGHVEQSVVSLLNPGVDPGPTHVHGLTAEMLEDQPQFSEIVGDVVELVRGRTLVAHNVAFDYGFLVAEAELADVELPIDNVMCTLELARRLELGIDNLRLETLAAYWGVTQRRPHDAFDDAVVLTDVLAAALQRARERDVWLPVRPVTRRRWPSGRITHDELRPLKMLASRMPCPYLNPGPYVRGRPLVQGMRVALAAEVERTHEELRRADSARGIGLRRRGRPGNLTGDLQRTPSGAWQGLPGSRAGSAGGVRREVHGLRRGRGRRHGRRGLRRRGARGRAIRSFLIA